MNSKSVVALMKLMEKRGSSLPLENCFYWSLFRALRLTCPLSYARMEYPARGRDCTHIQVSNAIRDAVTTEVCISVLIWSGSFEPRR